MEENRLNRLKEGLYKYRSPISVKSTCLTTEYVLNTVDTMILQDCREIGIEVDKKELYRALRYDREQYETGYRDGYEAGKTDGAVEAFDAIRAFIRSLPDGKEPEGEK